MILKCLQSNEGRPNFAPAIFSRTRKAIHEARTIRDAERAEPGIVKRALDKAIDAGEETCYLLW